MSNDFKRQAAEGAMREIAPGMRIGLGTGSTARHFVKLLGARVAGGFECVCVPTSEETARQAEALGIALTDLDSLDCLDVTVDGADEIGPELSLIKGGGGALLREKIVANASKRLVVIADGSKLVPELGRFPLPVEINRFGLRTTRRAVLEALGRFAPDAGAELRMTGAGEPFVTDGGHLILDASFGRISDARAVSGALLDIPGVVQHGLFLDMCAIAYVAGPEGLRTLER